MFENVENKQNDAGNGPQFCSRNYLINYDVDDDESASSADAGGAVNNDRTLKSRNRARINGVKTFYLQIYPFCGLLREL